MAWWTPVRPGRVVKNLFMSVPPGTAYSISQLHRVYKGTITSWNEEQGRISQTTKFRGMSYNSFRTYITRWIQLGLLEVVGHEPLSLRESSGLVGIRDGQVVEQTMTMLAITDKGRTEEDAWLKL